MNTTKTADKLNDLLEYLHDSHDGYKECAGETKNLKLKALFETLAATRNQMKGALQQEISHLSEEPVKHGSMLAAAHRLLVDLKSMLTGHDNQAIINEIRRGETQMIERYQDVIQSDIPENIKPLLRQQLQTIEGNLHTINMQAILETETV